MTAMARSSRADRAAARQCRAGDPAVREDHVRGAAGSSDHSRHRTRDTGARGACRRGGARAAAEVVHPAAGPPDPRPDPDDEEIARLPVWDLTQPTADPAGGPVLVEPGTKATAALLHRATVSASTPSGGSRQAGMVQAIMGDPHRSRSVITPGPGAGAGARWRVRRCPRRHRRTRRAEAATSRSSPVGTGATSRAGPGLPVPARAAATTWSPTPRTAGRCPLRTPHQVITPRGAPGTITGSRGDHR
ncbi:hypothetical protein SAMN05216188_107243 [Lentzea xinjiangensis]|uniref:Uncharacterized protein n=1 Tax=Lentzea xinjiangensis TaxID=402600 RepID=A0A1H9L400_9PSEU|nr:hypothetical protein SAMN05216188_107243 [Lentzea xinjiangensis]